MAATVNSRDLALQADTPRLIATSVAVTGSTNVVKKAFGAPPTPSTPITLTATPTNIPNATYTWTVSSNSNPSNVTTLGTTTPTLVLPASTVVAAAGTGSEVTYTVTASKIGYNPAINSTKIPITEDPAAIVEVGINVSNTVVSGTYDGVVSDFTGTSAIIKVSVGGSYINYAASGANSFSVAYTNQTPTGKVTGGTTFSGTGTTECTIAVLTGMASDTDIVTMKYTVTIRNLSNIEEVREITRTISKTRAGATGATGSPGSTGSAGATAVKAYCVLTSTNLPSSPTIGSSTVPTNGTAVANTPPTYNWYNQPKATLSADEWMFQVDGTLLNGTYIWYPTTGYLSTFKVGLLSALGVNTGTLDVNSTGYMRAGKSNATDLTNSGFFFGGDGLFSIGRNGANLQLTSTELKFSGNIYTEGYVYTSAQNAIDAAAVNMGLYTVKCPNVGYVNYTVSLPSNYIAGAIGRCASDSSQGNIGVAGYATTSSSVLKVGVYGEAAGTSGSVYGVYGYCTSTVSGAIGTVGHVKSGVSNGAGVKGISENNLSHGVYAENTAGGFGLKAYSSSVAIYADGGIQSTGNITAYQTSDRRLKENILPIGNALCKLKQINGVSYEWTSKYIEKQGGEDGYFVRKHDVGVIAQELQEVLPEAVAEREDGYLAVQYDKIIPLLLAAIKELNEKVERLENR